MATIQLPQDFHDFLSLLNRHSVEYLLIGGYAVNLYGFVRATGDMDVFIALNPDNVSRIVAAFHEFGIGSMTADTESIGIGMRRCNPARLSGWGCPLCGWKF
jgi:hypothetical protein